MSTAEHFPVDVFCEIREDGIKAVSDGEKAARHKYLSLCIDIIGKNFYTVA